ncbi:hypothetical protein CEXT_405261 [Caerostris extrusa]|uniref:Uncharacterized protein n=1 Tax=Caerostris extrusa TaxID=172846 RepID=A0AAV4N7T9_CAEEX|nr:hypothetical protein CEXT_405261 [Caerostris extrusa]
MEKQGETYQRTIHHNHIETLSTLTVARDTDLTRGLPYLDSIFRIPRKPTKIFLIFKKPKSQIHPSLAREARKTNQRTIHHNHIETLSTLTVARDTDLTHGLPYLDSLFRIPRKPTKSFNFQETKKVKSIHHTPEKQRKTYQRTIHHNHIETLSTLTVARDTDLTHGLSDDN